MKLSFSVLILTIFHSAFNNSSFKDTHASGQVADSQVRKIYDSAIKDATTNVKHNHHQNDSKDNPGKDLTSTFSEYIALYQNPCLIDVFPTFSRLHWPTLRYCGCIPYPPGNNK